MDFAAVVFMSEEHAYMVLAEVSCPVKELLEVGVVAVPAAVSQSTVGFGIESVVGL